MTDAAVSRAKSSPPDYYLSPLVQPEYTLGIDIGTTSARSALFDQTGQLFQKATVFYPIYRPTPGAAEQDPQEIFTAVLQTVRQVVQTVDVTRIISLSFSAAMHSLILLDGEGTPLSRCLIWADNRGAAQAARLKASSQGRAIYRRTGTPIHPMSPLVKLIWLGQEQPELLARAVRFVSIKEYVFYQLFGQYVVDHSIASATGLLNLQLLDWDPEAIALAGISTQQLSTLVPTTQVLRGMKPCYAGAMGLPPNLPVVIGASDGVLASLGTGAISPGVVAATVGTSGAIRTVVDRPQTDPQGVLFCYALTEKHWVIGGAVNNGGIALRWVRDQLANAETDKARLLGLDPYDMLTAIAATVAPGADGLIFHPYLAGERSPLWDAHAKASFIGLSLNHSKAHMIRAVLEGVIYNLYLVLETLEETIGRVSSIRAAGGFARSQLWRQMLADICNRDVLVPESYESSCFGAAILAQLALGKISDLNAAVDMLDRSHLYRPIAQQVLSYQQVIPVYVRLLDKLRPEYEVLAQLQRSLVAKPREVKDLPLLQES